MSVFSISLSPYRLSVYFRIFYQYVSLLSLFLFVVMSIFHKALVYVFLSGYCCLSSSLFLLSNFLFVSLPFFHYIILFVCSISQSFGVTYNKNTPL